MDPIACWNEILDTVLNGSSDEEADKGDFAYLLRKLAEWVDNGGFVDFAMMADRIGPWTSKEVR